MVSGPDSDAPDDLEEEDRTSRTGRFHVPHRGGTRIEVGEPIDVGGERPWMCAVKLMGRKREEPVEGDPTQTLLVRIGRGSTPEDARRDAVSQLTLVYGSPVEPPPAPVILQKKSDPPPAPTTGAGGASAAKPPGVGTWLARLIGRVRGT